MIGAPTVAIIPARYDSSRFPGKPLVALRGKPMVVHVVERAAKARLVDHAIVATDDERIKDAVEQGGHRALMTSKDCASGTDRCFAALNLLAGLDIPAPDLIINVQGDEPLIDPTDIDVLIAETKSARRSMGTLARPLDDRARFENPNVVKVVTRRDGRALYFSRAPIPHRNAGEARVHVGIYAYTRDVLEKLARLPRSPLEESEGLEQLRALEHGIEIHVASTVSSTPSVAIDRPEDVARVLRIMEDRVSE